MHTTQLKIRNYYLADVNWDAGIDNDVDDHEREDHIDDIWNQINGAGGFNDYDAHPDDDAEALFVHRDKSRLQRLIDAGVIDEPREVYSVDTEDNELDESQREALKRLCDKTFHSADATFYLFYSPPPSDLAEQLVISNYLAEIGRKGGRISRGGGRPRKNKD